MRRDPLRLVAVILVVLAVSPVTAPFVTFDLAAPDASHDEASLKPKPAGDKSLTPLAAPPGASLTPRSPAHARRHRPVRASGSHRPLRPVLRI